MSVKDIKLHSIKLLKHSFVKLFFNSYVQNTFFLKNTLN